MGSEKNMLLDLIFPQGYPDDWSFNMKIDEYIKKLGSYKIEELSKEVSELKSKKTSLLEQTQDLAVSNYKTFIETADCSRKMFTKFNTIDEILQNLLSDLPKFEAKYQKFADESSGINELRRLNSLTLTKNAQLLEILELPQLMHSCIDNALYDDAFELISYVRKLYAKHPDIPIFKNILDDVEKAWFIMLHQLLNQLRQDLSLPKCLQTVGLLRKMDVFSETELRLKFLQTRNCFLSNSLKAIPNNDTSYHLNKTIEVTRVNLFNIITQYKAIFNDDEHSPLETFRNNQVNQNLIFLSWVRDKIQEFLITLEDDLNSGVSSIDSILGQCMYFGLSFSKVGCDFRSRLVPIFTKRIAKDFQDAVNNSTYSFEKNIEKFTLINKNHPNVPWKAEKEDPLQPPDSLLEFYPLAEYLNNVLTAFNKLKLCAPVALIEIVKNSLQSSLISVAGAILTLYSQEQQAFSLGSKDAFTRLCMAFADDLIPHLQKCLHIVYPPINVASFLGVNLQVLQNQEISFLNRELIVEPIKHLLPVRIEPVFEMKSLNLEEQQESGDGNMEDKEQVEEFETKES